MTLAEFAVLVDASPKWVLNTRAVLGPVIRYTMPVAERLALMRQLNRELAIPQPHAWWLAGSALAKPPDDSGRVELSAGDGTLNLTIDVRRLQSAIVTRRSVVASMPARRRAGRKPKRQANAVTAATHYGFDVTLIHANLARTPLQRLRQLDGMVAFRAQVRREG